MVARDHSMGQHLVRKTSSPMAPSFMVSAPGKVIVFGEHAVVYGKAAMAAAVSLRSYLLVTTLTKSARTVTLVFPDIGLDHTWNIESLPWNHFSADQKKKRYYDMVTSLDEELVAELKPHLHSISPSAPEQERKRLQGAALAFLYLFCSISSPAAPAAVYTLRSTLPIAAGLGSSASVCVCLSAALLKQIHVLAGPHDDQLLEECDLQLERINRWAFVGELCIHGNPSGVDNTVSTRGKAVLFQRFDYGKSPKTTPIRDFPELPLLLINTKQPRSTATEVAKVASLKRKHPRVTEATMDSIDRVTASAYDLVVAENFDPKAKEALEHLGELLNVNHGLLVSLGVSHPKLEHIREIVDYSGIGWTKLTGAGGGGCAITLLKPETSQADIKKLDARIVEAGFEQYRTTLGGDGVGILYPSVLSNGSDEKGGEEIDQQKFLAAPNADAIEKLVGVGGIEKRPEWKFWR